jgi:hypothetical protein
VDGRLDAASVSDVYNGDRQVDSVCVGRRDTKNRSLKNYLKGSVDELRLYKRALSPEEIALLAAR